MPFGSDDTNCGWVQLPLPVLAGVGLGELDDVGWVLADAEGDFEAFGVPE